MIKRASLFGLLLVAVLGHAQSVIHLKANDQPKTVTLAVNQKLEIELDQNPTTGYEWQVDQRPDCLAIAGEPQYTPFPNPNHLVGMGGTVVMSFMGTKPGAGHLKLVYERNTESKDPGDTFGIDVTVTGDEAPTPKPPIPASQVLDEKRNGERVTFHTGESFWVSLHVPTGTPYELKMTHKPKGLEEIGEVNATEADIVPGSDAPVIVGKPHLVRFRFTAKSAGSGSLTFSLVSVTKPKHTKRFASFKIVVKRAK